MENSGIRVCLFCCNSMEQTPLPWISSWLLKSFRDGADKNEHQNNTDSRPQPIPSPHRNGFRARAGNRRRSRYWHSGPTVSNSLGEPQGYPYEINSLDCLPMAGRHSPSKCRPTKQPAPLPWLPSCCHRGVVRKFVIILFIDCLYWFCLWWK